MHRTGLIVALFIAAGAGIFLSLFPEIDLWIAQVFYDVIDANDNAFTLTHAHGIDIGQIWNLVRDTFDRITGDCPHNQVILAAD